MTRKYHYSLDHLHNITNVLNLVKLLTSVMDTQFSSLTGMSQHLLAVTYCRRHEPHALANHISGNLDQLDIKLYTKNEKYCVRRKEMLLWLNADYNCGATFASFHCTDHDNS